MEGNSFRFASIYFVLNFVCGVCFLYVYAVLGRVAQSKDSFVGRVLYKHA